MPDQDSPLSHLYERKKPIFQAVRTRKPMKGIQLPVGGKLWA